MNTTRYGTTGYEYTSDQYTSDQSYGGGRYDEVPYDIERDTGGHPIVAAEPARSTTEDLIQHRREAAPTPTPSVDRSSIVDPLDRIDEISALVEAARAVPMSANCMINRNDLLNMLEELRADMPTEIRRAQALLDERDKIIAAGQREADRIIAEGEHEHHRLVSVSELTVSAEHEAARIVAEARAEAQQLRDEVEEYVDTTLANFEQMLHRTMATVERGRDKMRALSEIGSFETQSEEKPLPF